MMNRQVLIKIFSLFCLVLAALGLSKMTWSGMTTLSQTDFTTYYEIPKMVFEGQVDSPYANFSPLYPYFYPPASLLIFYPLTLLSYSLAKAIWALLSLAVLIGGVVLAMRAARIEIKIEHLGIIFLAISFFYPLRFTLVKGQINTLLFFLLAAALYFFQRKKDTLSALCLALGTIIKISPAALLLYFLWKRKYKIFLWGVIFILLLSLAAEIFVQRGINFHYLRYVVDDVSKQGGVGLQDQSLSWFLLKVGFVPPLSRVARNIVKSPLLTYQRFVLLLNYAIVGLLTGLVVWFSRGRTTDRINLKTPLEYCLIFIPALLGTGLAWFHQYVMVLLPFIVAYGTVLHLKNRLMRGGLLFSLTVSFALMTTKVGGRIIHLKNISKFASPVFLYGAVLLWLTLLFLHFRKNHNPG